MKLKYYLRGLGIGILVTGLIMGISQKNAVASARAEVMRTYAQNALGDEASGDEPLLVRDGEPEADKTPEVNGEEVNGEENKSPEDFSLSEENSQESSSREDNQDAPSQADEPEASSDGEPEADEKPEVDPLENASAAASEEPSEAVMIVNPGAAALDAQKVTITISKGDDSGTVSRKLYNAGLIESASEYDAFLMQHGYDKRINTGEKVIGMNDTWQEIAEKITH